jgi:putative molybdopterin biosynthesis protein
VDRRKRVYRHLASVADARTALLTRFAELRTQPELVSTRDALGRVVVHPIRAVRSVPAYHAAAMDGLAVSARATFGARPERPRVLGAGAVLPINTGAPMPESADAVVMIENVEQAEGGWEIRQAVYPWQHVRKAGEDIVRGEIVLPARHRITPFDQGAALAAGIATVEVFSRPQLLILPTGNEVVTPEDAVDPLAPGAILEVNGAMLVSLAAECGGKATLMPPVPDQPDALRNAVTRGLDDGFDLVLVIAGSSTGTLDFTPDLLGELGELFVHGIAVMPGKPTLLAEVQRRPVIGIPGYPVSAVVCFRELVAPLLGALQGSVATTPNEVTAVMARKLPSKLGLEEHVRVIAGRVGGELVAMPLSGGAGNMTSLTRADGIVRVPQDVSGYSRGERVGVELLVPRERLEDKLLVIGSHDLTLDLLASLIQERSSGRISISSSNVGSTGGLLALARGAAHVAGSHLLDTETGDYNHSHVGKYLAEVPVRLITLVHRWQGFMVARGNPKGIHSVADLAGPDTTFVNRQPGSGTRILLDYELGKAGIDADAILGYATEEHTHMGVAMAVASARADAGLGIAAAAAALDLDFVPLARERYDLVIVESCIHDPKVELLLEIVRSPAFAAQVMEMPGYEVSETGTEPA